MARIGVQNIFCTSLYIQCMRLAIPEERKRYYNLTWEECMRWEGRDRLDRQNNLEMFRRVKEA